MNTSQIALDNLHFFIMKYYFMIPNDQLFGFPILYLNHRNSRFANDLKIIITNSCV